MASPGCCDHPSPPSRLLVLASTYPAHPGDGTPGFVRDLALREAEHFDTTVLVPSVAGAPLDSMDGFLHVLRFRYFPHYWEDLASGAILDNLRAHRSRWLQVVPFLFREALATRRVVRRVRPDIIHAHWLIPQGLIATIVARYTPLVVTTLGGDLYALNSRPFRFLKRRVISRASKVIVMSEDMRSRVLALGGVADNVIVLPMGPDLASFPSVMAPRKGKACRLLFVGRFVEKKGASVLAAALHSLPNEFVWELAMVGDGPSRKTLERDFAGMPVEFLGQLGRQELSDQYRQADVVVFPSLPARSGDQDGLPVALLEAMGTGCAVIGSALPGITEAIEPEVSGLLVPPGDSVALSEALVRLGSDPALRARLGTAAAKRGKRFDVSIVGDRYAEILHSIVSGQAASKGT